MVNTRVNQTPSGHTVCLDFSRQTFLFADLAGYTALTEAHGDETAADTVAAFYSAVRQMLPDHDAEEIKPIGDALMIRSGDAGDALALSRRIIDEIAVRHGSLAVRIGMHTGPAVRRDGDWFGAAVNLAARIADAAQPGEILMTDASREAAAPLLGAFGLEARGSRSFKNVAAPVALFAVTVAQEMQRAPLPIDPVCRMAVEPARAADVRRLSAGSIYFCASECADLFQRHPERYQAVSA